MEVRSLQIASDNLIQSGLRPKKKKKKKKKGRNRKEIRKKKKGRKGLIF